MTRHMHTMAVAISLVALAAVIVGCTSSGNSNVPPGKGGSPMGRDGQGSSSGSGSMMGRSGSGGGSYASDGERIFLSGVGTDGTRIARSTSNVAEGSLMMGGGGCGSCHGADGGGATLRMMAGTVIDAPDITYDALVKEGFTDAAIATAIRDGLDEKGERLDAAMPRWQMSDADVNATIAYLKVLSAR